MWHIGISDNGEIEIMEVVLAPVTLMRILNFMTWFRSYFKGTYNDT